MGNPFFGIMGGGGRPNMMHQFQQFMQSGKLSQDQLNQAQQKARQMQGMFEPLRGMFGK